MDKLAKLYLPLPVTQYTCSIFWSGICTTIKVSGATYAACDGIYDIVPGVFVAQGDNRPVYRLRDAHGQNVRFLYYSTSGGSGWRIGKTTHIVWGGVFYTSKVNNNMMLHVIIGHFHLQYIIAESRHMLPALLSCR